MKVAGLDVNENLITASDHGIMAIPALIFFKDGREVARLVGAVPKAKIASELGKIV